MKQGDSNSATIVPTAKSGHASREFTVVEAAAQRDELDSKLNDAREHLLVLRRQQEELERQKGELEDLRRKQDEYARGRAEMIENLTRGLVTMEREQIQAQRLAELCGTTREAFADYLEQLESINDEDWTSDTLRPELSKALSVIENSRLEYNRARIKLDCLNPSAAQETEPMADIGQAKAWNWDEMLRYLRIGAAASAPLIAAGTIWLILLLAIR